MGKGIGTLSYVRGLVADPTADGERLAAAQALGKAASKFKTEAAKLDKAVTLLKWTKEGSGCKGETALEATCKALLEIPVIATNSFGETRVLLVKADKKRALETCPTNANLGILVAAADGATV